jgi:hypothetical protein
MKKLMLIPLWVLIFSNLNPVFSQNLKVEKNNATRVEVYYFHATHRCPTCLAIEENTKKTLDLYFASELKDKSVIFNVVNIDDPKNKSLAEKYEASGSALILSQTVTGKETKTDLTDFAFSYGRNNPEKFISGLKDRITELLK